MHPSTPVLVIGMGEFGRTPNMGTQNSIDGRNHWPVVMSMCLAGGGMRHGQVIGASTNDACGATHMRPRCVFDDDDDGEGPCYYVGSSLSKTVWRI